MAPSSIISLKESKVSTDPHLPEWLEVLNLNETQVRQVFEIDALLEQRLQIILTRGQYSRWRAAQINFPEATEHETWTFEDINIDLSPYQQTAVEAAFQDSLQRVLAMLTVEQNQRLLQYLSEEGAVTENSIGI
ncbi:MAG: hypothetical protein AAGJ69_07300 [Cyanobacteria bacterium J06559_1]